MSGPSRKALDQKLIAAVNGRDAPAVQRLLKAGADVNAVGRVGDGRDELFPGTKNPALVIAVCLADMPTLRTLIRYGGSGWRKNSDVALYVAAEFGFRDAARLFLDNGVSAGMVIGGYPLVDIVAAATYPGNEKVVALLLDRGAPINAVVRAIKREKWQSADEPEPGEPESDEIGMTALMQAAENGNLETTRLLLARGADYRVKDARGKTALDHARATRRNQIAALLARAGSRN